MIVSLQKWKGKFSLKENLPKGLNSICHSANSLQPITQKCQRKLEKQFILVMLLDTLCTEQTGDFDALKIRIILLSSFSGTEQLGIIMSVSRPSPW